MHHRALCGFVNVTVATVSGAFMSRCFRIQLLQMPCRNSSDHMV